MLAQERPGVDGIRLLGRPIFARMSDFDFGAEPTTVCAPLIAPTTNVAVTAALHQYYGSHHVPLRVWDCA